MNTFSELGISSSLVAALHELDIISPTPIQAMAIPHAMQGMDILASAPTGTGKTLAYALPLITGITASPGKTALVLVPTRELATQVYDTIKRIISREIKVCLLIGGESITNQFKKLRGMPNFIIGTPGRINDHIQRGTISLDRTGFLVLDETDRMLDMGFEEQLENIVKRLPVERQTLMFSATFPHNIMQLSEKYLNEPQRVSLSKEQQPMPKIKQDMIRTTPAEKFTHLTKALDDSEGSVLIFVKTKRGVDQLADKLRQHDYTASSMHGDLRQHARTRTIQNFRDQSTRIMVATDVAARGLDIPHIRYVINYDLPQCKEDYVHRIGRTGRAGAEGSSLCLVAPEDNRKWQLIARMMENAGNGCTVSGIMEDDGYNTHRASPSRGGKPRFDSKRSSFGSKPLVRSRFNDGEQNREFKPRTFGDRPRSRPEGERSSFGDRDRSPRPYGDKPRSRPEGERSSFGDRDRSPRPYGDKPRSRPEGERSSFGDRDRSSRSYSDKPRSRPEGERSSFGDRDRSPRPYGDKPRSRPEGERSNFGDRDRSPRPYGDKPRSRPEGERSSFGDRDRSSRSYGDKPRSRTEGERSSFGDRDRSSRPYGDKARFRPEGERSSFGGKPKSKRSQSAGNRVDRKPSRFGNTLSLKGPKA